MNHHQGKYSAYRTVNFPLSMGAVTTGQEIGEIPAGATRRDDLRSILEKDWASTVHDF
jgi:hypothetical protein